MGNELPPHYHVRHYFDQLPSSTGGFRCCVDFAWLRWATGAEAAGRPCPAEFREGRRLVDNQVRFGVFLRPDPKTCAAVTQITSQLQAQYGLVSAGGFPPPIQGGGGAPAGVL